jgi:hypothetical protein
VSSFPDRLRLRSEQAGELYQVFKEKGQTPGEFAENLEP